MYERIKQLADEAVALQNKQVMDVTLRDISAICATAGAMTAEQFEAAETAQHQAARPTSEMTDLEYGRKVIDDHSAMRKAQAAAKKAVKK